jgi:endo-1,4-beta-xylanase
MINGGTIIYKLTEKPKIMKNNLFFKKRIMNCALSFSMASMLLLASCSKDDVNTENTTTQTQSGLKPASSARFGDKFWSNSTGNSNGFFYTIDRDGTGGSSNIDFDGQYGDTRDRTKVTNPGNFTMTWSNVKETVGGIGWRNGSGRIVNYNVGYYNGEVRFVGVYGWSYNPLTEYYVYEMGSGLHNLTNTGKSYYSDGHKYNIKTRPREGFSVLGTSGTDKFIQVVSEWGGASRGVNGSINMGNHFYNWTTLLNAKTYSPTPKFGIYNTGYMVFGCEAYNYTTNSTSGSMNATIW